MKSAYVVVSPQGLCWAGLVENEGQAWCYALGWPSDAEVAGRKADGWYVAQATVTWTSASSNLGHGWVVPRADGVKARCGGPAICPVCQREDEREAFKAWFEKDCPVGGVNAHIGAWRAWQARAARSSSPTPAQVELTDEQIEAEKARRLRTTNEHLTFEAGARWARSALSTQQQPAKGEGS